MDVDPHLGHESTTVTHEHPAFKASDEGLAKRGAHNPQRHSAALPLHGDATLKLRLTPPASRCASALVTRWSGAEEEVVLGLCDLDPARKAQWHGFQTALAELGASGADDWDEAGRIPEEVIAGFASRRLLGGLASTAVGGGGLDPLGLGLLAEAVGAASASLASLLTVQSMVIHAVERFGGTAVKQQLLPRLARGEVVGSFALSEPGAGSDLSAITTEATLLPDAATLSGTKTWLSFGRDAGIFLVFARSARGPCACLVEANAPGVVLEPVDGMLGFRAARLATLRLDACEVPARSIIGRPGLGLGMVALDALNVGRLCIAWASCGAQRDCLAATIRHVSGRRTSRGTLGDEPGIRGAICEMQLQLEASQALVLAATAALARRDDTAPQRLMAAKLFASAASARTAGRAVELLGAVGCSSRTPVARHFRDTKVLEIIEGANDMLRVFLGERYIAGEA